MALIYLFKKRGIYMSYEYSAEYVSTQDFINWIKGNYANHILPMFLKKNNEYGSDKQNLQDVLATIRQLGARNFPGLYSKHPYLAMVKAIGVLEDKHLIALAMNPTTNDYLGKAMDCVIYSLFRLFLLRKHNEIMDKLMKENQVCDSTGTFKIPGPGMPNPIQDHFEKDFKEQLKLESGDVTDD